MRRKQAQHNDRLSENNIAKFAFSPCGEVTLLAASGDGDGEGESIPRFELIAYTGGVMTPSWPPVSLVVDLAGAKAESGECPLIREHDPQQVLGQGRIEILDNKVTMRGTLCGPEADVEPVVEAARKGFKWRASLDGSLSDMQFVDKGQTAQANGRTFRGPVYIARKSLFVSASIVSLAGDQKTSSKIAARAAGAITMPFDTWLKSKGFDPSSLTDEQRETLESAWKTDEARSGNPDEESAIHSESDIRASANNVATLGAVNQSDFETQLKSQRKAVADEIRRQSKIEGLRARYPSEKTGAIIAQAIEENWTEEKAELELMRAARRPGPDIRTGTNGDCNLAVLEAALCLRSNVGSESSLLRAYGEQTLNEADKYRGLGLRRTVERIAASRGIVLPNEVNNEWLRAAFSSVDLGGILGAVANKSLGVTMTDPAWVAPRIAGVASHSNFHTHTVYSMALNGEMEEVAPSGELKHLSATEESYTRKVGTKGALLRITRQDIINDDLGVFARNAQAMTRKALQSREKALFRLINATGNGASFFTTAHKNYMSGATTALSDTSLAAAIKLFRNQTGPDGQPIMLEPAILLVPPELENTATNMLAPSSTLIVTGLASTSTKGVQSNANIYAGRFGGKPIVSPYLENENLTGYSTTAWYLLADPAVIPAFEIVYLNGNQSPTINFFGLETHESELAACWQIYWDFGVATAEYRAGCKSKGAA